MAHSRRQVVCLLTVAPTLLAGRAQTPGAPASGEALAAAARRQVGVTKGYDPAYHPIAYPGGDVPRSTGVCADVVIRAARDAWRADLQRLVHEDMLRAFPVYPHHWGLPHPDPNIDHRRVPNLETYWTRQGARLWRASGRTAGFAFPGHLEPGDILTRRTFPGGGPHVAIVSAGAPAVRIVQNFGWGAREDFLAVMGLHAAEAHYRWTAPDTTRRG